MCYKDEKQKELYIKFDSKSKHLPEFIKNYFVFLKSNNTKINNLGTITKFFDWLIDNKIVTNKIESLTPDDLSTVTSIHMVNYLDWLQNIGQMKYSSILTKMNVISGFWSYLVENDIVRKNIVSKKIRDKYQPEGEHEIDVPTDEEVEELIRNIEEIRDENVAVKYLAIIQLFTGSGIRMSELVGLDMEDLHFDCEEPYIAVMRKGKQHEKSNVPISKSAILAVNRYLRIRNANEKIRDMKPLFVSTRCNRLAPSTIREELSKCSNGRIHAHLFRHLTATKMLENGCNIVNVSKQLGHGDIKTTVNSYAKVNNSENYNALNSF